ncbi:hypothetical protein BJV77DRAFT_546272 [Russula vinacea]|nr:hypothetical protein BJV77DRAFT_546272 [Russula vinacea]
MCVLSATGEKLFSEGSPTKKRRGIGEEEGDVRHSGRTQSQDEESYTPCSPPTTLPPECGPSREIRSDTHSSDNRIERLTSPQPEQNHRPFPVRQFNSSRQSTLRAKKNTTISSTMTWTFLKWIPMLPPPLVLSGRGLCCRERSHLRHRAKIRSLPRVQSTQPRDQQHATSPEDFADDDEDNVLEVIIQDSMYAPSTYC